jgi:hypothetical protein
VVSGLTNGTSYTFAVHATTRAGSGPESAPSSPVTWTSSTALSPPLFPQASAGNQRATVSFAPPLDNGGSPVLSYTVTSSPGGISATGPASPITMTGLTNGVSYTFTVIATNANGNSQPSTPSNAVTPTAALAPPNDNIANAQVIAGDSGTVAGTNVNATLEPGEPQINGNPGGASIWYVWTPATGGGSATFNTCGNNFPTIMGVYRVTDPSQPISVTNIHSYFPGSGTMHCPDGVTSAPFVLFDINAAGGTFYIQVDGDNPGTGVPTGSLNLSWTK